MVTVIEKLILSKVGLYMKILVINSGSSSLKYQLVDMRDETILAKGICERIGTEDGHFKHLTYDKRKIDE